VKNCGLFSDGMLQTVATASKPDAPGQAPFVLSYDSATKMTIKWLKPAFDGGFAITYYRVYRDNTLEV
jgi:hypothetical protein